MRWVRLNVEKTPWRPAGHYVGGRYVPGPDPRYPESKPYRSYSKWHILHEKSQLNKGGRIVSLCGQFTSTFDNVEIADEQPTSGRRNHRRQSPTCYYCRLVAKATEEN